MLLKLATQTRALRFKDTRNLQRETETSRMRRRLNGWQRLGVVIGVPLIIATTFCVAPEIARDFPTQENEKTKHLRYIASTVTNMTARGRMGMLKDGESLSNIEIPRD